MAEIVQEVSPLGGSSPGVRPVGNTVANRPVITQTITPGGDRARVTTEGDGKAIEQTITPGGGTGYKLRESTRTMLANLDKHGDVRGERPAAGAGKPVPPAAAPPAASSAPATPAAGTPTPALTAAAPPAEPAKTDPAPAAAELERLLKSNRELLAQVEQHKAKPTKRELSAREKALDEIERAYLDDPIGSIRRLAALALGHEDPKHKDLDDEIAGLYQDLTAKELGVTVDEAKKANRESARTRQLLAREQRERKAEQESASKPQPEDPEAKLAADHTQLIGNHLTSKQADGKAPADAFPALMKFAGLLQGAKPEALILKTIRAGFAVGEFDPKEDDNKLIAKAATKIEAQYKNLYQALADVFGGANAPSTATPTPSDAIPAKKDEAQPQAGRSITNASASVAPATPPAQPAKTDEVPKYKTERERRLAIAERHLGK